MPEFERYIGIDYSGAGDPESRQSGIRIFSAQKSSAPREVSPEVNRNWSRKKLAGYLEHILDSSRCRTIVGIDHGFSFPIDYFKRENLRSWPGFLRHFISEWPTDSSDVASLRRKKRKEFPGKPLRLCEKWCPGTKSVFHFDVQGSVATSTFAGLPWLYRLKKTHARHTHFWPFDGWLPDPDKHLVTEVFPSLFRNRSSLPQNLNPHQRDAMATCQWLQQRDMAGLLAPYFNPPLTPPEKRIARLEGWILGLM